MRRILGLDRGLHRTGADDGFAMVLVLGIAGVISILVVTTMALAMQSLRSSRQHVTFESALSAAEAGVDNTLSLINDAFNAPVSSTYVSPSPCDWTVPATTPVFATIAEERSTARAALLAVASNPACRVQGGQGEHVAIHPTGVQTVYSMGFTPSYTSWLSGTQDAKMRMIKAEYLFAPYKPGQAVLTQGDLDFSGSVTINTLDPSFPSDIHSNSDISSSGSDISSSGSGSLSVQGSITTSGSNQLSGSCPTGVTGGCEDSQPLEKVPTLSTRSIYTTYATDTPEWYDLCGGGPTGMIAGTVRSPSSSDPCTGAELAPAGSGEFRGWSYTPGNASTPPVWTLNKQSGVTYPGVYYAYGANVIVGTAAQSDTWNITVIAESAKGTDAPPGYSQPDTCDKYGGSIDWQHFAIQNYLAGTIFAAEGSLSGSASTSASAGFLFAGDNVNLQTSSNTITGALISNNICAAAGTNTVQGVTVNYDQTIEGPVSDVIRTTLWLEYPGS